METSDVRCDKYVDNHRNQVAKGLVVEQHKRFLGPKLSSRELLHEERAGTFSQRRCADLAFRRCVHPRRDGCALDLAGDSFPRWKSLQSRRSAHECFRHRTHP